VAYHDRAGGAPLGGAHALAVLGVQVNGRGDHGLGAHLENGSAAEFGHLLTTNLHPTKEKPLCVYDITAYRQQHTP